MFSARLPAGRQGYEAEQGTDLRALRRERGQVASKGPLAQGGPFGAGSG